MAWEQLPVETDEDAVTERILDALAGRIPGWVPVEGAPEVALAEEIGRETAATNARARSEAALAFAGIGETIYGLSAQLGAAATMMVELEVLKAGDVIPAGFTVVGTTDDGVEVAFELPEQVAAINASAYPSSSVFPSEDLYPSPGGEPAVYVEVLMHARELGVASNGVPLGRLKVVTATSTVVAAATTEPSSGGVDPETLEAYLTRLTNYIGTLRPGGVRAEDLATIARNVTGVYRALGVDMFDPGRTITDAVLTLGSATVTSDTAGFTGDDIGRTATGTGIPAGATIVDVVSATTITLSEAATADGIDVTVDLGDLTDQERTATVVPIDTDGLPVTAGVAAEVEALLEDVREVNFLIRVAEPTYTPVHVAFQAVAETGADPALVQATIHADLTAYLDPARWGATSADPTAWGREDTVRYLDLARIAGSADGVAYLTSLTLNDGTSDVTLPGAAPLPAPMSGATPSTITGNVA